MPVATDAPAILFFCHGARQAAWRAPFDQVLADFRRLRPGITAGLAFLEFMSPDLLEASAALVATGARRIRIVPLFLSAGGHTITDLAQLCEQARARWPDVQFEATATLMESASIRQAIVDWSLDQVTGP